MAVLSNYGKITSPKYRYDVGNYGGTGTESVTVYQDIEWNIRNSENGKILTYYARWHYLGSNADLSKIDSTHSVSIDFRFIGSSETQHVNYSIFASPSYGASAGDIVRGEFYIPSGASSIIVSATGSIESEYKGEGVLNPEVFTALEEFDFPEKQHGIPESASETVSAQMGQFEYETFDFNWRWEKSEDQKIYIVYTLSSHQDENSGQARLYMSLYDEKAEEISGKQNITLFDGNFNSGTTISTDNLAIDGVTINEYTGKVQYTRIIKFTYYETVNGVANYGGNGVEMYIKPPPIPESYDYSSSLYVSSTNIGSNPIFTITKQELSSTATITYTLGSRSGTIVEDYSGTSYSDWTVPLEFYYEIPDTNMGQVTYTITTTASNGTYTKTAKAFIYADVTQCAPTMNATVQDVNTTSIALTGDANVLVGNVSTASYKINPEGFMGAEITSVVVSNGATTKHTDTGTIEKVQSGTFDVTLTDSRGFSVIRTVSKEFVPYVYPTANLDLQKTTPEGVINFTVTGLFYDGSFGAVDNTFTLSCLYRQEDESANRTPIPLTYTKTGDNEYSATGSITGLDYRKGYYVSISYTDALGTRLRPSELVNAVPVFDWGKSDFNFNVPVNIMETINVPSGGLLIDGEPMSEGMAIDVFSWYPELYNPASTSITVNTRYGYYIKIKNLCILNWFVSCSTNSTSSVSYFQIKGLPYTPSPYIQMQSGGGTLTGARLTDGHTFCGWQLATDGTIYARTLPLGDGSSSGSSMSYALWSASSTIMASGTLMYRTDEDGL